MSAPIVLSLARTRQGDLEAALRSVETAKRPGIHIFIATSELHLKRKLMMSHQEVVDAACWAVGFAKQHLDYVEFSAEDASRSDPDYLVQVFGEVIKAGACTLNVPDTTGYAVPQEFGALFRDLIARTPGGERVIWSAHCHNDLGMAVANSLAAVRNGARQVECTINGIGERAGNTSLEEVVMAIKTRRDVFDAVDVRVDTRQIYPVEPPAVADHRHPGADQQAGRRRQRLRPRGRHPSGRRAEGQADLRDHAAGDRSAWRATGWCSASTPAATPSPSG